MNINLDLYKTFYYVAKNGNITRAANELMISQPAISKSIKTLEEQMSTTLFVRKRDGVILTEAGELFFKKIKNAMELIESAENDIESLNRLDSGYINIGASKTIIHEFLMPYIKGFHKTYPNIKIRIFTDKTIELYKKAKLGLVDVIISNLPSNIPDDFHQIKLMDLHDCFVANESFSYLKDKTITLKEFQKLPLLVLTKGAINRTRLDDFCIENDLKITPEMEFGSNTLIKEFTEAGFGIGMLTKEHIKQEIKDGTLFELNINLNIKNKFLGLIYSKDNNRLITKKFISFLKSNRL